MFFCNECRYLFNITKDIKGKQLGGKINVSLNNLFEKYNKNEKIDSDDLKNIKIKNILNDERFEAMNKKDQKKMLSFLKDIDKEFVVDNNDEKKDPNKNTVHFICKFCKNNRLIEPGTLIYSRKYGSINAVEAEDYSYVVYDNTLARTKNYICKNTSCETHENHDLREAVLLKNNLYQIIYVCTVCKTHWINMI